MPSINTHIALNHDITARCLRCAQTRNLDLVAISDGGNGYIDLLDLPLRCNRVVAEPAWPGLVPCGGEDFSFVVSPQHTGPAR